MANAFSLTSAAHEGRYLQLTCTQNKNVSENKSIINWTLKAIGGTSSYYDTGPTEVKINGKQVYYCARKSWSTKAFPATTGSTSGNIEVSHDDNGNKSISVSMSTAIYTSTVDTKSGTWTLDSIQRASQPSCITWPNTTENVGYIGDIITIHMNRQADFTHTVRYSWYSKTGIIGTGVTNNCQWTIPDDFISDIPNGDSSWGTIYADTYSGSKLIGTKSVKFTVKVPDNSTTKPTVIMNLSLNNSDLPDSFSDIYIQGKSKVNVTLSGSGKYNANIRSYSALIEGKTYNSQTFISDVITGSGTVDVIGYAKDSRGFTGSVTQQITVIPYSKPLVIPISSENAIMCYRSDGNGTRVGNSTSVWVKAKLSFSQVNANGVQKNTCALQWRRKLSTDLWDDSVHKWSDLISATDTNNQYNALLTGSVFNVKQAYTVQIRAVDTVGETDIKTFDIPTQDVALHLGKGGKNVSVGTYCDYSEDYTFYSDWEAIFAKGVRISDSPVADFIIKQGVSGIWNYRKWHSGVAECWGTKEITIDVNGSWGQIFTSSAITETNVTFPFAFIEVPTVNVSLGGTTAGGFIMTSGAIAKPATKTETGIFEVARGLSAQNVTYKFNYRVVGRWK